MAEVNESLVTGGDDPFLPKLIAAINQATRIDIVVSFMRASGFLLIKPALEDALEADVKVRIITGGYLSYNRTQSPKIVNDSARKTHFKIYESGNTAFHMKSYIFVHREDRSSKDGIAYVGSSNISHSALNHGLEWNLRITSSENQSAFNEICSKFKVLFENPKQFNYQMNGSMNIVRNTNLKLPKTR